MNTMNQPFPGVHSAGGRLATRNLAPGVKVYGEKLHRTPQGELREWDTYRSKLAAGIVKGLKRLDIRPGASVLYLGAASGTTASHVSDIVGANGIVFCVEFAPRCMRDLLKTCGPRGNMIPLLEDARLPESYRLAVEEFAGGKVGVVFEDVADPQQAEILQANCKAFLKPSGQALIAVKARSISAVKQPQEVYATVERQLSQDFEIEQKLELDPFDKDHEMLSLRLRK